MGSHIEQLNLKHVQKSVPLLVKPPGFGVRHCQTIMGFTCLLFAYTLRVNLSVAIVAMTDNKSDSSIKVLPWDIAHKGIILSSMFWGYVVLQIPVGHLARVFGPKYLMFGAMMFCSLITIIGPLIALNCSWIVFCISRFLQGLGQGFFFPCINTHIAKWAPPQERSRIVGFIYVGGQVGATLTLFGAGHLAASPWGWPSIFYVTGACGVLWSLVWLYLGADCPDSHSTISDGERDYIKSVIKNCSDQSKKMRTPWWQIMKSGPLLTLLACSIGQLWSYWTMITMLPLYFRNVLGFDIKNTGLISSLPYLTKTCLTIVFSCIADFLISKKFLSVLASEKLWNTIALWGGAATLIGLSFVHSATIAVVLLTISVGCGAGIFPGYISNHLDLAPNFAGLLIGITNGIGNISSIVAPIVAGFVIVDETSHEQWMIVFYICAAAFFFSNLIFLIFGTAEVQPWNDMIEEDEDLAVEEMKLSIPYSVKRERKLAEVV